MGFADVTSDDDALGEFDQFDDSQDPARVHVKGDTVYHFREETVIQYQQDWPIKVSAAIASSPNCVIEPLAAILFSAVWLHII